jgi:mono/diheme cytochrome c family protein
LASAALALCAAVVWAETPAERGFRLLTEKPYLTPDFDQEVFDKLYTVWPRELRKQAEQMTPEERRRIAFERYGLDEFPGRARRTALQYAPSPDGGWTMTCLACHTGRVAGRVILGAPNTWYALQTLTEEVRTVKYSLGKKFAHMDNASLVYPLGDTIGTTNAVMFGQILLTYRDPDLTFRKDRELPNFVHHDVDAIPWWHYKRKTRLYVDGFAPKSARALMQFLLIPRNGPDRFAEWESDYRDIEAWISSIEAPQYPWPVDKELAKRGETLFTRNCAECHGTYGPQGKWPEKIVPLETVDTDPVRLQALTVAGRQKYEASWFCDFGRRTTIDDPGGYVAPPLDGVWASAPYLHNGSVPTLDDLLRSESRPKIWHRSSPDDYDRNRVGFAVERLDELPAQIKDDPRERRRYFDTRLSGKSARGHTFGDHLTDDERRAVIEYLKTL